MIPDKLLINLKIISKIQKNGRIARSFDGIISLENDAFYQSIKRFVTNDSRKQAVFEINSVITECIDILNHITNSKFMNKLYYQSGEYIKNCECIGLLLKEMELAKTGVENLKFTYQNDPNIVSQIDIVILKINTTIKDFYQKLMYFQNYIQNDQYNFFTQTSPQEIPKTFDVKQNQQSESFESKLNQSNSFTLQSVRVENEIEHNEIEHVGNYEMED
jgi:hypothetical protein